jgi:hypothetical protein
MVCRKRKQRCWASGDVGAAIRRCIQRALQLRLVCAEPTISRSALPYLLAGMRIGLALALIVAVVAEMVAGNQGIGHY